MATNGFIRPWPHLIHGSLDPHKSAAKWHLNQFTRFCRAHPYDKHTDTVSKCLTSLFSTNTAISKTKGQRCRAIPTQWRKASNILTSTLATFWFSIHRKRERDREAHLNYYDSANNRGRQLSHCKIKLNQIRLKQARNHASLTKNTYNTKSTHTQKLKPGLVASYDIRPRNGIGLFWYNGKKMKKQENRWSKQEREK